MNRVVEVENLYFEFGQNLKKHFTIEFKVDSDLLNEAELSRSRTDLGLEGTLSYFEQQTLEFATLSRMLGSILKVGWEFSGDPVLHAKKSAETIRNGRGGGERTLTTMLKQD